VDALRPISKVKGWEDFGFAFKEGNDETGWDDQHGITTFRYTEPDDLVDGMPKGCPARARPPGSTSRAWRPRAIRTPRPS